MHIYTHAHKHMYTHINTGITQTYIRTRRKLGFGVCLVCADCLTNDLGRLLTSLLLAPKHFQLHSGSSVWEWVAVTMTHFEEEGLEIRIRSIPRLKRQKSSSR